MLVRYVKTKVVVVILLILTSCADTVKDDYVEEPVEALYNKALIKLANFLTTLARPGALVSRFGGDEFAMWLNDVDKSQARKLLQPLLFNKNFIREFSVDQRKPFGISAGIVSLDRSRDETSSDLIERADVLMYQRKRNKKRRQASK